MVHNERDLVSRRVGFTRETLDDFPFVPRGNFGEKEKKTYFFDGYIWTTNRVLPLFFNFCLHKVWFDASALSSVRCQVEGKSALVDSLDSN